MEAKVSNSSWPPPATVPLGVSNVVSVAAGAFSSAALKADGTVVTWSSASTLGTQLAGVSNAVATSAYNRNLASTYTLVLRGDGRVLAASGSMPTALASFLSSLSNAVAIGAGDGHCLAITSEGTVLAGGANTSGQSDVPLGLSNVVAVAAGQGFSLALKDDGTAVGWGMQPAASVPETLTNIVSLAAGNTHGMALLGSGSPVVTVHPAPRQVWEGEPVQLTGLAVGSPPLAYRWLLDGVEFPDATNKTFSLANARWQNAGGYALVISNSVGMVTSKVAQVAIRSQPSVAAWGFNGYGQTDVPAGLKNITQLYGGFDHSVALLDDGTLAAWGDNRNGQCTVPVDATNIAEVACGSSFTLARRRDGTLRIWGANPAVEGDVLTLPPGTSPSKAIAASYSICASVSASGAVTTWGGPSIGIPPDLPFPSAAPIYPAITV